MEGTIKNDFDNIKKKLDQINESINQIHFLDGDSYNDVILVLNEISDKDNELCTEITEYIELLRARKKDVQEVIATECL
jgi:hypothetical protein